MAIITDQDIDDLAVGAAVLGTGGGGDPYIGKLLAKAAIEKYGPVDLLSLKTYRMVPPSSPVAPWAHQPFSSRRFLR